MVLNIKKIIIKSINNKIFISLLIMTKENKTYTLIGAGIISATLAIFLKKLMPNAKIQIYERLSKVGAESSAAWNNAGTGHSAFCELNYTPELEDGTIDLSKALKISEQFEISKQLWAHLKSNGELNPKQAFINDIDHMSFVWGKENKAFLKKRYNAMTKYPIFEDMKYTEDSKTMEEWAPLIMKNRTNADDCCMTRMAIGTDVNFGAITRGMIEHLKTCNNVDVNLGYDIHNISKVDDKWEIEIENLETKDEFKITTDFVFIGAGGGAIPLLEKTDIPESKGYGGFPVSGQWLKCTNPEVIKQHEAKVYGKADVGSPPMSVPHLDTRMMDGKKSLLFGPYAGFSTKFLKNGSYLDFPMSIEIHNIWPLISAGWKNLSLTKYLVKQVFQSMDDRFEFLLKYYPDAKIKDWELVEAGKRVQIIKDDEEEGGKLQFGTEIVTDKDLTLAALLGASPGASTSVSIMLDLLEKCFPDKLKTKDWQLKIKEMIPSYGESLITNGELLRKTRANTTHILKLEE